MKIYFFLLCFVMAMAKVSCKIITKIDLMKLVTNLKDLKSQNPKFESETKFLIKQINSAIVLESNAISFAHYSKLLRSKRQAPSINCAALQIQLNFTQNRIKTIQSNIEDAINFLIFSNSTKQFYEQSILNKTISDTQRMIWQNFLNCLMCSVTSTKLSLQSLQRTLALMEKTEMKLRTDLDAYCTFTTPTPATALCGTFVPFDTFDGVSSKGFAGGIHQDGSTAFVGFGNASSCSNQMLAPCVISSAGCKIPCGSSEILDSKSFHYLLGHSNLEWIQTTSNLVSNVVNALKLPGSSHFMFGRAFINDRYVLGKIQSSNGNFFFQAVTTSGAVSLTSGFEVLRCKFTGGSCPVNLITSISPGSSLNVNQTLSSTSSDGCTLKLSNGDLVLTAATGNVTWRAGITDAQALFNFNGTISVFDASGKIIWSIQGPSGSTLLIENCQLVLKNGATIIWNSSSGYIAITTDCFKTLNITDSNGWTYKKICVYEQAVDFSSANNLCKVNNMRLLTIRNQLELEVTFQAKKSAWWEPDVTYHVDGVKGSDSVWRYFDGQELWNEIRPRWDYGTNENYLNVRTDQKGGYFSMQSNVSYQTPFLCEYDVLFTPLNTSPLVLKTPNLAVCEKSVNITDDTGVFYKGICRIWDWGYTYLVASRCITHGMRLLTIRNQREFDAAGEIYRSIAGPTVAGINDHIDGAKDAEGVWRFWDKSLVPSFLIPKDGYGTFKHAMNLLGDSNGGFKTAALDYKYENMYSCEYAITPTTTTTTTTIAPVISGCNKTVHITDSNGWTYKKICIYEQAVDFNSANNLCKANNMQLLTIRNQLELEAMVAVNQSSYAFGGIGAFYHVDGVKGNDSVWRYFDGQELWNEIRPRWDYGTNQIYLNIRFDGIGGYFSIQSNSFDKASFLCEFDVLFTPLNAPPLVLKAANFSICQKSINLTDDTGAFYKGICRVSDFAEFYVAASRCIGYGMRLLTVRNQREFDAVDEMLKTLFGATPDSSVTDHIDGAKDGNGVWRYWDQSLVPSFMIPTLIGYGSFNNAMNFRGDGQGGFHTVTLDSNVLNLYFCEYSRVV